LVAGKQAHERIRIHALQSGHIAESKALPGTVAPNTLFIVLAFGALGKYPYQSRAGLSPADGDRPAPEEGKQGIGFERGFRMDICFH
jgi:hypothetical protein